MIEQQKGTKDVRKEKYAIVKDLMKHRMNDSERYLTQITKNLYQSKDNLTKVVRENTLVRKEFMEVVNKEVNKVWKDGKKKDETKAMELWRKYGAKESVSEMHLGVCISDDKLEEIETEMEKNNENKNDKPAIYAGIKDITDDQEKLLMMNPNHRIYSKLKLESFETELEKCYIKSTWEKIKEGIMNENNHKAPEANENETNNIVNDDKAKSVDFRNMRATDMKGNKRIYIAEVTDDAESIRINNVKAELKKVFVKYMDENCDSKGNLLENNLSDEQVKTIKDLKSRMKIWFV